MQSCESLERRSLAWAWQEHGEWVFVISPTPEQHEIAWCTVNILIEYGQFGSPYPVEIGWYGQRAIMNERRRIPADDHEDLYESAADFLKTQNGTAESAFAEVLRLPDWRGTRQVRWAHERNALAQVITVLGLAGGAWVGMLGLFAIVRCGDALAMRANARAARRAQMCPACGYDVRGLPSGVCPECGRTIPHGRER